MATSRRTQSLPLPTSELDRLKGYLAPHYGAQVWEGSGARILVVRVPTPEPDVVNDIEAAVEHLLPGDVQDLTAALLVGSERTHAVSVTPFQDLMARRVQFDHGQAKELRRLITSDTGHRLYRHASDPRKVLRLGIRVPHASVKELDDEDLGRLAAELGPVWDGQCKGVRAVYLVAASDDVRIDGDLFAQDLKARFHEEADRRLMAAQIASRQGAAGSLPAPQLHESTPFAKPGPKSSVQSTGLNDPAPRVAFAPIKRHETGAVWEGAVVAEPATHTAPTAPADATLAQGSATSAPPLDPHLATLTAVNAKLSAAGFDVLQRPPVHGHKIDLAAERQDGDVQRVIVQARDIFTAEAAREALDTARTLSVDLLLVVAETAEPEAKKRIIATKVRYLRPDEIGSLGV